MRTWLSWLLKLIVTAGLLGLVLRRIEFGEVWSSLAAARPVPVLLGLTLVLLGRTLASLRMKLLTDRQRLGLSVRQLFGISCVASFYGLALPGTLAGGAVRWHRLSRQGRTPARSLVAILLDRLLDTIALVGCGLGFWLAGARAGAHAAFGWGLAALLAGLSFVVVLLLRPGLLQAAAGRLERWPLPARVRTGVRRLDDAVQRYHRLPGRFIGGLVMLSVTRHLIGTAGSVAFVLAVGLSISWVHLGWIRSLMMLAVMLPISISGFGVREAGAVFLLGLHGVPASAAVAWALLSFTRTLLPAAIGGLLEARSLLVRRATSAPPVPAPGIETGLAVEDPL